MPTSVLPIDPARPDPDAIRRAADVIRAGGLVAFPTETVYGLGANALDAKAVGRIFAAKGRPAHNPLIVHVADEDQARRVADGWPETAEKLAAAFWPGPLTLVLPRSVAVSERVTAGGVTVAVRCPVHPVARSLIAAAGVPIAAPSANHSGELSPTRAEHVTVEGVDLILDGGPCSGGIESTVVDVTRPVVRLLRPGPITVAQLEAVVGQVEIAARSGAGPLPSPGMLARHYAPRTRLELAETEDEADDLARVYETAGLRVARWKPSGTPAEVAARLYADLHALDAGGYDRIVAALPPDADEWRAVRDRLTRAAAE
jgi:L-threonylcarbamoyladenylate synthase